MAGMPSTGLSKVSSMIETGEALGTVTARMAVGGKRNDTARVRRSVFFSLSELGDFYAHCSAQVDWTEQADGMSGESLVK